MMQTGIISDIHEDVFSLEKALTFFNKHQIQHIICLGDLVGSARSNPDNANRCIELVKNHCFISLCGNHDLEAANRIPDHRAGFNFPPNWYELSRTQQEHISGGEVWIYEDEDPQLTIENKLFLKKLPEFHQMDVGYNILFSHYAFPDLTGIRTRFIEEHHQLDRHFAFMEDHLGTLSFAGHRHPEGCLMADDKEIYHKGFGIFTLEETIKWVDLPCIVEGAKENGLALFEPLDRRLELIPLKKL